MKKIIVALLLVVMGVGMAQAEFRYGIKAGLLINKLHLNQKTFASDNSCGWTAGAMVQYTVPIVGLNFDAGLMYARMNNASDVTSSTSQDMDADVFGKNFLEIPVNIRYGFNIPVVSKIFSPYIFTGPNFAFRLDKNVLNSAFKSHTCQVAWNVGLGLEFIHHLQIGASYGFGINNIISTVSEDINAQQLKVRNNYWTVSAAYLF